jgi:hypothetical protein
MGINHDIAAHSVLFPNGNRARLLSPPSDQSAKETVARLGISVPRPVVLILGGADEFDASMSARLGPHLAAIVRAAGSAQATIIDGGTQSGVMDLMGREVARAGYRPLLIGVAPAALVTYPESREAGDSEQVPLEPNHSHFVLGSTDEWGSETELLFQLAEEIAAGLPVIAVVVNGGETTRSELESCLDHKWCAIVLRGTGRFADELYRAFERDHESASRLSFLPLDGPDKETELMVTSHLAPSEILEEARELLWLYDFNAQQQQRSFRRLQLAALILALAATCLAIVQNLLERAGTLGNQPVLTNLLHYVLVLLPISVGVIISGLGRFRPGNKWVALRASAEAVRRELFLLRTKRIDEAESKGDTERQMAERLKLIRKHLMATDVKLESLRAPGPPANSVDSSVPKDDGLTRLTGDRYITVRLSHQLRYFKDRATKLAKTLTRLRWLILILGGAGTLLAAAGLEIWIALTTTLTAALVTYLEYEQVESSLVSYNRAATELENVELQWRALTPDARSSPGEIQRLVRRTEKILHTEQRTWTREMEQALDQLRIQQEKAGEGQEIGES